jgi:hypothetical protein
MTFEYVTPPVCAVSLAGRTLELTDALKPAVLTDDSANRYALWGRN